MAPFMAPLLGPLSPPSRGRRTPEIGVFGPVLNPTARTRGYIYSIYIHPDPRDPETPGPGVDVSTPYNPPEVTTTSHYILPVILLQGSIDVVHGVMH